MDEFSGKQLEMELIKPPDKAIYVKLTPGTELFNRVVACAEHLEVKPTKAARILLRAGWAGYAKSKLMDMRRVEK